MSKKPSTSKSVVTEDKDKNHSVIDEFFQNPTIPVEADQHTAIANTTDFRAGYIAIVGRPNVGKSTLMNHLLGQKLSITSRKPQTTRHQIRGIYTTLKLQAVFVDTPGIHTNEVKTINQRMNQAATSVLTEVDVVFFVIEAGQWREDDQLVLDYLQQITTPVVLLINKIDQLSNKQQLLPILDENQQRYDFADIVPIAALHSDNLDRLTQLLPDYLPENDLIYPIDQLTNQSERFLASEIIREKIMRSAGEEVPYGVTVTIESFKDEAEHTDPKTGKSRKACTFIDATIWVERSGQKAIIIGQKGAKIKQLGIDARQDMERLFNKKIMLTLWVKVKANWSDDPTSLTQLGY